MDDGSATVVAVNEENQVQNHVSREEAHRGDGIRHRAYTVVVRDGKGRILLARRSEDKQLWPGYWDGTVASHQPEDADLPTEVSRRLREELGIEPDQYDEIQPLEAFEYKAFYRDVGVEWEICTLLTVDLSDTTVTPNPAEVSDVRWEHCGGALKDRIENYSLLVCPWFEIALERLMERDSDESTTEGSKS